MVKFFRFEKRVVRRKSKSVSKLLKAIWESLGGNYTIS